MRSVLGFLPRAFLALVILVTGSHLTQAGHPGLKRPQVVFINPGKTGEVFWSLVSSTMVAAAKQLNIDLRVEVAERSRVEMKRLAMATINAQDIPDAIVLVNEEQASVELLEAADARGIKVLMLLNDVVGKDRELIGEPGERNKCWLGAIVPDNRSAGKRMTQKLLDFAVERQPGGGNPAYPLVGIYGDTITPASIERNGGLADMLRDEDRLTLDHELIADWNREKARTLMNRVLQHYQRLGERRPVGIWAANDPIALGAIDALRDNGLEPGRDVGVVGLNWSPMALKAVADGSLLMTDGGHFFGGAWAMVVLRDYFDGRDVLAANRTVRFTMSPVHRGNLDDFSRTVGGIIMRGAYDEIDFSRFLIAKADQRSSHDFSLEALIAAVPVQ